MTPETRFPPGVRRASLGALGAKAEAAGAGGGRELESRTRSSSSNFREATSALLDPARRELTPSLTEGPRMSGSEGQGCPGADADLPPPIPGGRDLAEEA